MNGLILQWSGVYSGTNSDSWYEWTYPISFSTDCFICIAQLCPDSHNTTINSGHIAVTSDKYRGGTNSRFSKKFFAIGYQLNGLIIQWGKHSVSDYNNAAYTTHTVSFHVAYTYLPHITFIPEASASESSNASLGIVGRDSFIYYANYYRALYWFSIGYQLNGLLIQWGFIRSGSGIVQLSASYTKSYIVVQGFDYYNNNVTKVWSYDNSHIITEGGPSEVVVLSWLTIGYQSNGLLIQWMLVSVSNREVTLPAPFSNSSSYISIGTIRLTSLSDGRTAYCQIGNISDRTFFVRARMDQTSYNDACYCFFIGY